MTPLWFIIELILFLLILIPTMVAFFTGAPWVPTPRMRVCRMLELAKLKPGDRIYDLGCGDGRMVQLASEIYRADAIGLELSPLVYGWARIRNFFLHSKAQILLRDFRRIDYSNAKALVFYLLPEILSIMRPKLERELRPGARVISYAFEIEGWTPSYIEPKDPTHHFGRIFVYEMPKSKDAKGSEAKK